MELIELIVIVLFSVLCAPLFIYSFLGIIIMIFFPDRYEEYEEYWDDK